MSHEQKRVSPLLLERYLTGDVSAEERRSLERAIAEDGDTAAAIEKLRGSDREIREQYPAKPMVEAIMARAKRKHVSRRIRAFPAAAPLIAALAGIAAAIVLVAIPLLSGGTSGAVEHDRIKGNGDLPTATELRAYLKTDPGAALGDQALLGAGNTIQLAYAIGLDDADTTDRYGLIFSIDGRGAVSLHYPYSLAGNTRLAAGKQTLLDEAYTLDDAPGYEAFFFVVADSPPDVGAMLRDAEKLAIASRDGTAGDAASLAPQAEALFAPCEVTSLILRKIEATK
jgi:hypothetical protein